MHFNNDNKPPVRNGAHYTRLANERILSQIVENEGIDGWECQIDIPYLQVSEFA